MATTPTISTRPLYSLPFVLIVLWCLLFTAINHHRSRLSSFLPPPELVQVPVQKQMATTRSIDVDVNVEVQEFIIATSLRKILLKVYGIIYSVFKNEREMNSVIYLWLHLV